MTDKPATPGTTREPPPCDDARLICPFTEWAETEIERLEGHISMLRSVVASAMEWDGADDEGVPAVWIEAAEEALKETE